MFQFYFTPCASLHPFIDNYANGSLVLTILKLNEVISLIHCILLEPRILPLLTLQKLLLKQSLCYAAPYTIEVHGP